MKKQIKTLFLIFLILFFLIPINIYAVSTIGTSTSDVPLNTGRGTHPIYWSGSYWFSVYFDGTNIVYRTSSDGSSWSSPTTIDSGSWYGHAVEFVGTTVHFTRTYTTNCKYKQGTISDDSISWSSEYTVYSGSYTCSRPSIISDEDGYIYVSYQRRIAPNSYRSIKRSTNTEGSAWGNETNLYAGSWNGDSYAFLCKLTGQKIYAVYGISPSANIVRGKIYDSGWGDEEEITTSSTGWSASIINNENDVWCTYATVSNIEAIKRTYGVGWGSAEEIHDTQLNYNFITKSDDIQIFIVIDGSDLKYKKNTVSGWDDSFTTITTGEDSPNHLRADYNTRDNDLGIVWRTGTGSPWNLRFEYITIELENYIVNEVCEAIPSSINDEEWFRLNITIQISEKIDFTRTRIDLDYSNLNMSYGYVNSTGLWIEENDPNDYADINVSNCEKIQLNSTYFRLSFYLQIHVNVTKEGYYDIQVFSLADFGNDTDIFTNVFNLNMRIPEAPYRLFGSANSTIVNLSWTDNSTIETGFEIQRSADNITYLFLVNTVSNYYNDTSISINTYYYYRVRAYRITGVGFKNSTWSNSNLEKTVKQLSGDGDGETEYITVGQTVIGLPLNLYFYTFFTFLGLWLLNRKSILTKIISCFLFAFMSIWLSNNILLNINLWRMSSYNTVSGNYVLSYSVQNINTPFNNIIVLLNIILAFISIISLYRSYRSKSYEET